MYLFTHLLPLMAHYFSIMYVCMHVQKTLETRLKALMKAKLQ